MSYNETGKPPTSEGATSQDFASKFQHIKKSLGEGDSGYIRGPLFKRQHLEDFVEDFKALMKVGKERPTTMTIPHYTRDPADAVTVTLAFEGHPIKKDKDSAGNKEGKQEEQTRLIRVLRFKHGEREATLKLHEEDVIKIDFADTMWLASFNEDDPPIRLLHKTMKFTEKKEIGNMYAIQSGCPLFLSIDAYRPFSDQSLDDVRSRIPEMTVEWNNSAVRKSLIDTIKNNAKDMPRVGKIVCFGLGRLTIKSNVKSYCQHLAAIDIRDALAKDENHPNTIEIYTQDPFYSSACKTILKELGIKIVDAVVSEGLPLVDQHTFVLEIGTAAEILEPIIDLAGPLGPAGLLSGKLSANGEKDRQGGMPKEPIPKQEAGRRDVSDRLWKYKNSCKAFAITDDKFLGGIKTEIVMAPGVHKCDEHGNIMMSKFDTELLLRKLPGSK
ncbi:hypothetical protein CC80DRAFT_543945 [Byssothecium circinans]|uniref:SRR1-like domain-containing protein n=1 Tax=Byssothecium circinans TaxID=147558 RepID=A0A6A5U963_9PLEO|nr:hypothetical protein CC80DRAFT_543945 [Byssothecium circinans]